MKEHLIPLPVPGQSDPDLYRIHFGGAGLEGPREACASFAAAIESMATRISGAAAVEEAHRAEYAQTWAPLLARKSLPGYIASVVPAWAYAMHDAQEASHAA